MDDKSVDSATRLDPKDAPLSDRLDRSESLRQHYRRLEIWNRDSQNWKWVDEQRQTKKDRKATLDAIAGQLELTNYQRERAWRMMQQLSDVTYQGTATGLLCLCVAAIACREDGRFYHPKRSRANNDEKFDDVRQNLGFPEKHVRRCYNRVRDEVDG